VGRGIEDFRFPEEFHSLMPMPKKISEHEKEERFLAQYV
jgi:hypothetical protein